jgi:hypothetical protein
MAPKLLIKGYIMNNRQCLLFLIAVALTACVGTPKVPRDARSENFEVTSRYLELGGTVYMYMDVEGDIEGAAQLLNEVVAVVDEIPPRYKERLDAVGIARHLGLTDVRAVGMSSHKYGDRYINKSFTRTVYPRTGLMRYFGGEPHPFEILELAPADAVLAFEMDINFEAFLDTLYILLKNVAEQNIVADVDRHLDSPIVPGSLTYRQLLSRMDTKMMGAVTLHPSKTMILPELNVEVPVVQAFFAIDNMGPLMDILVSKAGEIPVFSVWEDSEWQRIGVSEFLTEELLDYRPVIWRHKPTQRLYLATGADFLEERLQKKNGLGKGAVFQDIAATLPIERGNSLMYVSPDVYHKLLGSVDNALAREEKLASVRKVIDLLASKVSPGSVWMSQNTHDGIYQISSSAFSHKLTLMGAVYLNQIYAFTLLGTAGEFAFDEAFRDLFSHEFTPDPTPESPDAFPEEGPGSDLEKQLDRELQQQSPSQQEEVPEYVDKFLKKWNEDHPGDEI